MRRGQKHTAETRRKISEAKKGKHLPLETRQKISEAMQGKRAGEKNPNWKGGRPHCADCGKELCRYGATYCKRCACKGGRNYGWKGGITSESLRIRHSAEYGDWRKSLFERDDYMCSACGERGGRLVAHHLFSFSEYPNLRLGIDNGITMHARCHALYADGPRKDIVIRRWNGRKLK